MSLLSMETLSSFDNHTKLLPPHLFILLIQTNLNLSLEVLFLRLPAIYVFELIIFRLDTRKATPLSFIRSSVRHFYVSRALLSMGRFFLLFENISHD